MQRACRALVWGAAAVVAVPLGVGSAAAAHEGDDGAPGVEVVVGGLDNPRGLAVDRRGDLWIAQSGRGGDGPCFPGPEGPTCLGATGKISVLRTDHRHGPGGDDDVTLHDVVTGLPSLGLQGSGNNAIGPTDVTLGAGRQILATIGLGGDPDARTLPEPEGVGPSPLASRLATVGWVHERSGTLRPLADIGAFELAVNPEPSDEDTNPYAIAAQGAHRLVTDAGGNALLRVHRNGDVETVHVFPQEPPVQNPFAPPGVMIEADPVPNSIVVGPDGAFYIGQLTGFPFTPGTATVWRYEIGEEPTVYADGFTNIIDLAFTQDGDLLVLEISHQGLLTGDLTGALIEVSRHDPTQRTVLLQDPLFAPGGIAVHGDHAYISNRAVLAGGGEILRVRLPH